MAQVDIQRLEHMAKRNNVEAALILELIEKCKQVASGEQIDGITAAMGLRSERDHDEILASVTEDMIGQLLPTILKMSMSGVGESFFYGLSFQISIQQRIDIAMFTHHRMHGEWPKTINVSDVWRPALNNAALYTYESRAGQPTAALKYANQDREQVVCE